MGQDPRDLLRHSQKQAFATTQWSVVLAAGEIDDKEAQKAIKQLCEAYWYPLYAYVRRRVGDADEAQDLTQAFFAHLLEKQTIAKADRSRGRFRSFLLTVLKNFLANERAKARAKKRGRGQTPLSLDFASAESRYQIEPSHVLTPEAVFDRRWVHTLLDQVLEDLRRELVEAGKTEHFEQLKHALTGAMAASDFERAAQVLGITPAAAKQAAYRLRNRYRELFRQQVARTVADPSEVDNEIGRLLEILGG